MKRKDQLRLEFFDVNLTLLCLNVRNNGPNGVQESNFLELQTLHKPEKSWADEPTTPRTELPD